MKMSLHFPPDLEPVERALGLTVYYMRIKTKLAQKVFHLVLWFSLHGGEELTV